MNVEGVIHDYSGPLPGRCWEGGGSSVSTSSSFEGNQERISVLLKMFAAENIFIHRLLLITMKAGEGQNYNMQRK